MYRDIDTTDVILRRRHKTFVRINRKDSWTSSASDSSDNTFIRDNDKFEFELRDLDDGHDGDNDEDDDDGSVESNPFGFIRYYTGKKSSCGNDTDHTIYESFIDHGSEFDNKSLDKSTKRVSSMIGSIPIQITETTTPPRVSVVVHTSTARLNLGEIKQQFSENSQVSSFEHRISGGHMACEDLVNLDDTTRIKNSLKERRPINLVEERHHSMPSLFVGNRFNNSTMTKVYIPSWKDKKQKLTKQAKLVVRNSNSTTHSNSVEPIPVLIEEDLVTVPVPDNVTAEILYNLDGDHANDNIDIKQDVAGYQENVDENGEIIITPPIMFRNNDLPHLSLSREVSPFRKHSINSDKKMSDGSMKSNKQRQSRRCVSYQFVQIDDDELDENGDKMNRKISGNKRDENNNNMKKKVDQKCGCCANSRCQSPRSSDSGMAGSCTISSPDPPKYNGAENDDTNSFGTRSLSIKHSRSSHNIGCFEFTPFSINEDTLTASTNNLFTDSGQYGCCDDIDNSNNVLLSTNALRNDSTSTHNNNNNDDNCSGSNLPTTTFSTSRDTVKSKSRCRSVERSFDSSTTSNSSNFQYTDRSRVTIRMNEDENVKETVYRTGLYAHWWKKESLPNEIIKELIIYRDRHNNNHNNKNKDDGRRGGSGKKNGIF